VLCRDGARGGRVRDRVLDRHRCPGGTRGRARS
jgi:hypothetical protein